MKNEQILRTSRSGKKKFKIKSSAGYVVFSVFNVIFITLLTFTFIAPYINILAKSLNAASDTMLGGLTFWPRDWTFDNFMVICTDSSTWSGLLVSVARVIVGTVISVGINYMAAYALLRKGLRFKKVIIIIFTIPMFVSGGLVSEYIIYAKLGIIDSFWVYVLPAAFSFYNMVIIRTYTRKVSASMGKHYGLHIVWKIQGNGNGARSGIHMRMFRCHRTLCRCVCLSRRSAVFFAAKKTQRIDSSTGGRSTRLSEIKHKKVIA